MKASTRRLLNLLFIVATFGLIVGIAFSNNEMANAWSALFTLDPVWVWGALGCWLAYLGFDALSVWVFLRSQKHPVSVGYAFYISVIGFYYGNITPGASGGQPMQIYYMNKHDVPVGVGSSALSLKFFCSQLMVVALSGALWIVNRDFVNTQLATAKWAVYIGFGLNFIAIPGILCVALFRAPVQAVIGFFIRVGAKLRLIKDPERVTLRADAVLDTYHASIVSLGRRPGQIIAQLLLAGLSMLGLMMVPVCVYHAFGLSGVSWGRLLTISCLLFMSASYTPLPGASGAQEGGFLVYFRGLFTQGTIGLALLIWRFFTYYLFLLVGGVISIAGHLRSGRKKTNGAST